MEAKKKESIHKKIPEFKNIEEERLFWSIHDITEYLDDLEEVNEPIELDSELEAKIKAKHRRRKLLNIRLEKELMSASNHPNR